MSTTKSSENTETQQQSPIEPATNHVQQCLLAYQRDFERLFAIKPESLLLSESLNLDALLQFLKYYDSFFVMSAGTSLATVTKQHLETSVTRVNVYAIAYTTYIKIKQMVNSISTAENTSTVETGTEEQKTS